MIQSPPFIFRVIFISSPSLYSGEDENKGGGREGQGKKGPKKKKREVG